MCMKDIQQLKRHLTMSHDNFLLDEYLQKFDCHEEYYEIENSLKHSRSKNSPWSVKYYTYRGFSEDEAKEKIEKLTKNKKKSTTYPAQKEHWLKKGLTENEAIIRAETYKKDIGKIPSLETYVLKYGASIGRKKWEEYSCNITNRGATALANLQKKGYTLNEAKIIHGCKKGKMRQPIDVWASYENYRKAVDFLTFITKREFGLEGKPNEALDHMYSCYGGWYNKISPYIIASIYNLRFIDYKENCSKGQFCVIEKEQLLKEYKENRKNQIQHGQVWEENVNAFIDE